MHSHDADYEAWLQLRVEEKLRNTLNGTKWYEAEDLLDLPPFVFRSPRPVQTAPPDAVAWAETVVPSLKYTVIVK